MADEVDRVVFQAMLRPYRVALITLLPVIGTVGTYGYDLVAFVKRDEVHEQRQSADSQALQERLNAQQDAIDRLRRRHLEVLQVLISDLDLLRSKQVELLPAHKRGAARRHFDKQREKSIRLLVEAQGNP